MGWFFFYFFPSCFPFLLLVSIPHFPKQNADYATDGSLGANKIPLVMSSYLCEHIMSYCVEKFIQGPGRLCLMNFNSAVF